MTKPKQRFSEGDLVQLTQAYKESTGGRHKISGGPFRVADVAGPSVKLHSHFITFTDGMRMDRIHQNWLELAKAPERLLGNKATWPVFQVGDTVRWTPDARKTLDRIADNLEHVVTEKTGPYTHDRGECITGLDNNDYTSSYWLELVKKAEEKVIEETAAWPVFQVGDKVRWTNDGKVHTVTYAVGLNPTNQFVALDKTIGGVATAELTAIETPTPLRTNPGTLLYQAVREQEALVTELRAKNKQVEARRVSEAKTYDRVSADATKVRKQLHNARKVLTAMNAARSAEIQARNS